MGTAGAAGVNGVTTAGKPSSQAIAASARQATAKTLTGNRLLCHEGAGVM